jgi:DNA-binding NarL/FixJ family response regulator
MIEQHIYIVIICPSEIVLAGLSSILNDAINYEIIAVNSVDELFNYPHLSGYVLLIVPEDIYSKNSITIKKIFSSIKNIKVLKLCFDNNSVIDNSTIGLFEPQLVIFQKINQIVHHFSNGINESNKCELSKREIEVLRHVAKGISNKEIANSLNISVHTIISHRKNICEKIGIKSSSGLTMYAVLKKIVNIDEIDTSELV